MKRMIDSSDWRSRCMICARLMHKKNTSKDCDNRDNNNNNSNNNNNKCFETSYNSADQISFQTISFVVFIKLQLNWFYFSTFRDRHISRLEGGGGGKGGGGTGWAYNWGSLQATLYGIVGTVFTSVTYLEDRALFKIIYSMCVCTVLYIPFPVVWSDEGPVFEDEVIPLWRVQSNTSEEDWLHP